MNTNDEFELLRWYLRFRIRRVGLNLMFPNVSPIIVLTFEQWKEKDLRPCNSYGKRDMVDGSEFDLNKYEKAWN